MTQEVPEEGDYFIDQDSRTYRTRLLRVVRIVNPYGRARSYAICALPSGRETTIRKDRLAKPSLFKFDGRDAR